MFAVIFRASIAELDESYSIFAAKLRELAIGKYGCTEFVSMSNNGEELSISYWHDLQLIAAWKQDAEHLVAQQYGKQKWYKSYRVEVMQQLRAYSMGQKS